MSNILRTPDHRFKDLPDFPYEPCYLEDLDGYKALRLHYIDEGSPDAENTFLCLHGEPTWAYLYRKMIPVFKAAGNRIVAPDFFGFGRSDKPLDEAVYTFDFHRNHPDLAPGRLMELTCPHLSANEYAAYDAPFPDRTYKAGVRRFPELVPDRPDAPGAEVSRQAREWLRSRWSGQTFMAVGTKDPVLGVPVMHALRKYIRNCPVLYEHPEAGHFAQEWGEEIAIEALKSFGREQ